MSRADRDEWAKRVQRWMDSGLTAREFANEVGLKPASLSFWKWRLKKDEAHAAKPAKRSQLVQRKSAPPARFVELTAPNRGPVASVVATSACVELVTGAWTVRVPNGVDDVTLRRVLTVVRELS